MSTPPERLPKLTEVVDAPTVAARLAANRAAQAPELSEEQLVQRVLADVQRQVDLVLEHRLREALAPALARLTDALVREARNDLASTLREVVTRAVAQELSRHRAR
ncbi:MAG TPA: hypothetical protein VJ743_04335 [Albitalea sp.]|nr:hypothetical protein [Albitalea sp.]